MVNRYGNTKIKLPTQYRSNYKAVDSKTENKRQRKYKRKCWVCNKGFIQTKEYEQKKDNTILKMKDTFCSNPLCKFKNTQIIG